MNFAMARASEYVDVEKMSTNYVIHIRGCKDFFEGQSNCIQDSRNQSKGAAENGWSQQEEKDSRGVISTRSSAPWSSDHTSLAAWPSRKLSSLSCVHHIRVVNFLAGLLRIYPIKNEVPS